MRKENKGTKKLTKVRGSLIILVPSYISKSSRIEVASGPYVTRSFLMTGVLEIHMLTLESTITPSHSSEASSGLTFLHEAVDK